MSAAGETPAAAAFVMFVCLPSWNGRNGPSTKRRQFWTCYAFGRRTSSSIASTHARAASSISDRQAGKH